MNIIPICDCDCDCDCALLVIEEGYNKKVAPFQVNEKTKEIHAARVNVSLNLRNVIEISEQNHKITFKFAISLGWYEHRALYHNLKDENSYNVLNDDEIQTIWTPYVIYENTDNDEAVTINEMVKTTIFVRREGSFVRSGMDVVDEIEIYKGKENGLTMIQTYSKEFQCTYLIQWFPFDTQVHSFEEN